MSRSPAVPARCGVDLASLALGSLLSEGSLGLAEGEAAGLAFLQQFSNAYWLIDVQRGPESWPGAAPTSLRGCPGREGKVSSSAPVAEGKGCGQSCLSPSIPSHPWTHCCSVSRAQGQVSQERPRGHL